ncbi:hypothetical protein [Streptomyces lavendofoliae]|uniref:hypothetical protein n=1 Tax=Streptomyces lavendofoliae TaxID=67314 RepID=UPI00300F36EC
MRGNRKKSNAVLAALVCAGVTGLAGCGESAPEQPFGGRSADEIAARAVEATRDAESVRLAGTAHQRGSSVAVDFRVDEQDNCVGTMSGQGAAAEVRQTGRTVYLKGNEMFWRSALQGRPGTDKTIAKLQGKWVRSTPGQAAGTQGMCDKQAALAALDGDKSEREGMRKGATTTVEGKEALALHKRQPGGEKLTLYVATEGEPYVLKATTQGGKTPGEMLFTDYNKKVDVAEPPAGQVVDPATVAMNR